MLDKFLVLLERFVVAHELIAANSARRTVTETVGEVSRSVTEAADGGTRKLPLGFPGVSDPADDKELPIEGEGIIDTPKKTRKEQLGEAFKAAKPSPEPEDDLADDEPEEEEKPKRKPRQAKAKEEPAADLKQLREDIKTMAKSIAAGESDECADKFDDLLDAYDVRTVNKLADDQVEKFYEEAKALVAKYYEIED